MFAKRSFAMNRHQSTTKLSVAIEQQQNLQDHFENQKIKQMKQQETTSGKDSRVRKLYSLNKTLSTQNQILM
jgi:hypothetical protein